MAHLHFGIFALFLGVISVPGVWGACLSPSELTNCSNPEVRGLHQNVDIHYKDSSYAFIRCGRSWSENRDECKVKNGDLVSMETEEEWKVINDAIQQLSVCKLNEWHIGLTKNKKGEWEWEWVSGVPLQGEMENKWQSSQPSGDGNFVIMAKQYPPGGPLGRFNDLPNWMLRPYICEVPRARFTPSGNNGAKHD